MLLHLRNLLDTSHSSGETFDSSLLLASILRLEESPLRNILNPRSGAMLDERSGTFTLGLNGFFAHCSTIMLDTAYCVYMRAYKSVLGPQCTGTVSRVRLGIPGHLNIPYHH